MNSVLNGKNVFFATGVSRSGTTALAKLLKAHPKILMSIEKFNHRIKFKKCTIMAEDFAPQNYFSGTEREVSDGIAALERASWVGEKSTVAYMHYDYLREHFSPHFIYIFRNIIDVSSSFNGRAQGGNRWPADTDYRVAVQHWNTSIKQTLQAIDEGYNIHLVQYERMYEPESLRQLFAFLGLDYQDLPVQDREVYTQAGAALEVNRKNLLTSAQKVYILRNANFGKYREICERVDAMLPDSTPAMVGKEG